MKLILILRSEENKRPIRYTRKSEYWGKLKTKRSVPKNAKLSVLEAFRFVPKTFCSVPKAFRSVLEVFRFVQAVQRSRGVHCTCSSTLQGLYNAFLILKKKSLLMPFIVYVSSN